MNELTVARLKERVVYDPSTGVFRRLTGGHGLFAGTVAGTITEAGYVRIGVDRRVYPAHRLAWFYVHGKWPSRLVDHRDGNPTNNRIANLREATAAENQQNRPIKGSNPWVLAGVTQSRGRWQSQIQKDGVSYFLGRFNTPAEAHEAYLAAKAKLHKFHPVPNR